jgi:hypothetical protein
VRTSPRLPSRRKRREGPPQPKCWKGAATSRATAAAFSPDALPLRAVATSAELTNATADASFPIHTQIVSTKSYVYGVRHIPRRRHTSAGSKHSFQSVTRPRVQRRCSRFEDSLCGPLVSASTPARRSVTGERSSPWNREPSIGRGLSAASRELRFQLRRSLTQPFPRA